MSFIKSIFKSLAAIIVLGTSSLTYAVNPLTVDVQGNTVEAVVQLPGDISADLTLRFENAIGLTSESIGITAELIDVTDLSFLNRLPAGLNVTPATAFPLMITVEPIANSGFAFSGLTTVDIHTHNLEYTTNTPLRFFKAPLNGEFKDITMTMGSGSYRARGSTGKFSQFIIVADLRAPLVVVNEKYDDLVNAFNGFSNQINPAIFSELLQDLNDVQQLVVAQNYSAASNKLNEFNRRINDNRGINIPDVWRSSRDINNVAGELMAYANTLRFSLRLVK